MKIEILCEKELPLTEDEYDAIEEFLTDELNCEEVTINEDENERVIRTTPRRYYKRRKNKA